MKKVLMASAAALGVAVPFCSAVAAENSTNPSSLNAPSTQVKPQPQDGITDIVVTARKTEEKLQRIPVAVTALSTAALKQQTIQTTNDVQFHVPGLVETPESEGAQSNFSIRGTRQLGAAGSQGGVAVYLDYVPVPSTGSIVYSTYDMQSIQVLKGPQGTLFGKNTTGGAIIFSPNKPTSDFNGFLTAGYGSFNRKEVTAMVNLPVSDTLALRVSGNYVNRDGYVKNVATTGSGPKSFDDEDHGSVRAILRWTPSSAFTNEIMADYTGATTHPLLGITLVVGPPCTTVYPGACDAALAEQQALGKWKVDYTNPEFQKTKDYGIADTATYKFGGATLRNIFAYREYKFNGVFDNDNFSALPILQYTENTKTRSLTDELDLFGKLFDDHLDYTLGLYYSDSHFLQNYDIPILGLTFDAAGNVTGGLPPYFGVGPVVSLNLFHTVQKAVFGQLTYHIDDKFSVTMGGRYTNEKQKLASSQFTGTISPTDDTKACATTNYFAGDPGLDVATCTVRLKQSFSPMTWNFSLNYQANPNTLVYASAARGFQAGGFNNQVPITQYQRYKPETVHSFETGVKSDWRLAGRPVRTNLAVFYAKYQAQQRSISDTLPNGQTFIATFNAANSTMYGLEAELGYRPTANFELSAFYSYIHAKYDQFMVPAVGVLGGKDLSDSAITSTPKHTLGGTAAYSVPVSSEGHMRASLTAYYRSGTYTDDLVQTRYSRIPGYALLNGRIDLLKALPIDLAFYVNNITDKTYPLYTQDTIVTLGYASARYGAPRTFGGEATFKF